MGVGREKRRTGKSLSSILVGRGCRITYFRVSCIRPRSWRDLFATCCLLFPVAGTYVSAGPMFRLRFGSVSAPDFAFFFFNDAASTEFYTLSLHDALPNGQDVP